MKTGMERKRALSELSISQRDRQNPLPQIPGVLNPFHIDDQTQIFQLKQQNRLKKLQERHKLKSLRIWEKGLNTQPRLNIRKVNQICSEGQKQPQQDLTDRLIKQKLNTKQPAHQFIQKKKEMLLFQMMIDHKREQIKNYQQLTKLHKRGLMKSQQMLEEDINAFNEYLNESKRQARIQIKQAEEKAKIRTELTNKIKQLLQNKADLLGKNTTKLQQLQTARKYKQFLDNLNPNKGRQGSPGRRFQEEMNLQIYSGSISPQLAKLLQEQDQDDQNIFLKDPQTLIKIFLNLEENNLYLISQTSETKQSFEEFKKKNEKQRRHLEQKKAELTQHRLDNLKQEEAVKEEIVKLKRIRNINEADTFLSQLYTQIPKICKQVSNPSLLQPFDVLKDVEKKLQDMIRFIVQARQDNEDRLKDVEKKVMKKKQHRIEKEVRVQVSKKQDERGRQRRQGRPIMAKVVLREEKKVQKVQTSIPEEQIQRKKYFQ